MNKVSIVIPVFNAGSLIQKCISSIQNQSYSEFEVIIVDDGCTDNTIDIAIKAINGDVRFNIFKNEKKGVSSARNYGISKSKGEYLAFVDADDYISSKFIETLVKLIENKGCDCSSVMLNSSFVEEENFKQYNSIVYDNIDKHGILAGQNANSEGYVCNKLYKLNIIKDNKIKFDEQISIGEDLLFNNQYFVYSNGFVRSDVPLYFYRLNSNSSVNRLDNEKWFDLLKVYEKILNNALNKQIYKMYLYNYSLLILEAQYRQRYCKNTYFTKSQIRDLRSKYVKLSSKYSLKKNIKLFIFMCFPNFAMKYKRRKVND
ncbi:MAG: glycosyltransferase family 2 protein [Longibaculum sp.]